MITYQFPMKTRKIQANCWMPLNITLSQKEIFQSWYTLGSMYSGAFKTQSEFYHKLNSVANDCNFTNKDEIEKFLYLTHNKNTRVHEHLLKGLTDTTSLADMLCMARVCEGNVNSEEISKQYLGVC